MKRYSFTALVLLLVTGLFFTACNTDDGDNLIPSRTCIIKNLVLGTLEKPRTVKDSHGKDSTYIIEITGANFPMSIDQLNGKVYNADSLPKGTDVSKVVFATIQATGSITVKSLVTGEDTIMTINDTLDFRQPRQVTVQATDRAFKREYTVEIRVHQEDPDSINWKNLTPQTTSPLKQFTDCRILTTDDALYVFGQHNNGSSQVIATSIHNPDFTQATDMLTQDGQTIDIHSIQFLGQTYYALSQGQIYSTTDVTLPWAPVSSPMKHFDALATCSADSLYALEQDKMYSSADGIQWILSAADTAGQWPSHQIISTLSPFNGHSGESILLLSGIRDKQPVLWQRLIKQDNFFSYPWMFMPQTDELGKFAYPVLEQPCMVTYDQKPLLFGLSPDTRKPVFYQSSDNGRSWKPYGLKFPQTETDSHISIAVDKENFVWSVCCTTGQVFKGRHNRLGWTIKH